MPKHDLTEQQGNWLKKLFGAIIDVIVDATDGKDKK